MRIIAKYANKDWQHEYYCPYCNSLLYYLYDQEDRFIGLGLDKHLQCSKSKCNKVFKIGIHGFQETNLAVGLPNNGKTK